MQKLRDLWMESNSKERDVIIMAFWYTRGDKSTNARVKEFLNYIVAKEDRVIKVMHNMEMVTNMKNRLELNDLEDMDVYNVLGVDPYIHIVLDYVGEYLDLFKKTVQIATYIKE